MPPKQEVLKRNDEAHQKDREASLNGPPTDKWGESEH